MNKRLTSIEDSFRLALEARFSPPFLPSMFVVASQASLNKKSAKFAIIIKGHVQRGKFRAGAKWVVHVPDVYDWRKTEQRVMIDIVVSELEQYISKGYIEREDFSLNVIDSDDAPIVRMQRTSDRSIN